MIKVFQCNLCQVFFETCLAAKQHLKNRHFLKIRGKNLQRKEIKTVTFPKLRIHIPKQAVLKQTLKPRTRTHNRKPRSSKHTVQKTANGVEIKLDSLKASEIETLINDLFPQTSSTSVSAPVVVNSALKTSSRIRKSAVLAEESIKSCTKADETQDPDEERFISLRKRKNGDDDYVPTTITSKLDDEGNKRKPGRPKKSDSSTTVVIQDRKGQCKCRICNINYRFYKEYIQHMTQLHLTNDKYICPHCQYSHKEIQTFTRHLKKHVNPTRRMKQRCGLITDEDRFKCDVCGKICAFLSHLEAHKAVHEKMRKDPTKVLQCPLCPQRFARKHSVTRHFVLHLENNPFVCKFTGCGVKFASWEHLHRHVSLHVGTTYKCTQCKNEFNRPDGLSRHMTRMHSGKCDIAIRKARTSSHRVKRITQLADDNLPCTQPDQEAEPRALKKECDADEDDVRVELESVHFGDQSDEDSSPNDIEENMEKPVTSVSKDDDMSPTPVLNQDFLSVGRKCIKTIMLADPVYQKLAKDDPEAAALVLPTTFGYQAYNIKKQEFKCTLCHWTGVKAHLLQAHMTKCHDKNATLVNLKASETNTCGSSSGEIINVMCGRCGYQAKSSEELSEHINSTHTSKVTYDCKFCGFPFGDMKRREIHEKIVHLQPKKFACSKCPAKYIRKSSLNTHEKQIHDEEYRRNMMEKHKCKKCGKPLSTAAALKCHLQTHTQELRVSCKICNQICSNPPSLRRHIRYVHLNVPNPYSPRLKPAQTNSSDKSVRVDSSFFESTKDLGNNEMTPCDKVNETSIILGI